MKRNIVTAFLSIAGGRIGVILVSALVTPALVYQLTPAQYGAYGVVMAVFGMLMILVSSGINSGVRKYLAEDRDDDDWASSVFGFYFRIAFALAVVPAVIFVIAAYTGLIAELDMFGPRWKPYFYLLAVLTLAAQFREYVRRSLMGLELEHISEPIKVLHKVAFGVVAVSLVYLGFGVEGVLAGEIIASGLAFLVAFALISREISLSRILRPVPSGFPKWELFNFNYLTVVYIFLLTSMYHIDLLMVNGLVNSQTAGTYKGALVIVQFLWLVPRSVQSVLIQSTSGLWADDNVEKVNEMASKATRYTLLFTLLLAIGLAALARDFVPLYLSEKHAAAVLPVLLLLPGTLGFAIARPIFAISHAKGELKVVIAATGASAVINLVLNALLIPFYGMVGAAVATSIGYGSLPFFHYWGARQIGYEPFADARLPRIALTGLLTAIPTAGLAYALDGWLALLVVPPLGFALYAVFALVTGAIDVDEVLSVLVAIPGISPYARRVQTRLRRSSDPLMPFDTQRTRVLLNRALLIVGALIFAAGIALAIGLEDPDFGFSDSNLTSTSTPTATPLPDGDDDPTATASPSPDSADGSDEDGSGTPTETDPPPTTTSGPTESPTTGDTPTPSTPGPTDSPTPASPDATTTPTPDGSDPDQTDQPTASPTTGGGTESPTPTPTDSPPPTSSTPTPTGSPTPTATDSPTPTPSPTESPTDSPTPTESPPASATPTPSEGADSSSTSDASPTPTPAPSATPTSTSSTGATPTASGTTASMGAPGGTSGAATTAPPVARRRAERYPEYAPARVASASPTPLYL